MTAIFCEDKKKPKPCAFLWDESYLWALMARQALKEARLPFDIVQAKDVRKGVLADYRMLFVPGGWAGHKISALGKEGVEEIRHFVADGGSYLGICGGAGLATADGLALLPISRKPQTERLPSFSGPIRLACDDHPLWRNIEDQVFCAWWPSQFCVEDREVKVIATYDQALPEAFSSDIQIADGKILGWSMLEERYGIFLDPARLLGEPAVVEGRFGRGKVLLSLIHFDTPSQPQSAQVLRNLWHYLADASMSLCSEAYEQQEPPLTPASDMTSEWMKEIEAAVNDLLNTGERNFLWSWRNPFFLKWRRGVRGLEYSTLAVMTGTMARLFNAARHVPPAYPGRGTIPAGEEDIRQLALQIIPFIEKAKKLLVRERFYLQHAALSPLFCADPEIHGLRLELFGPAMSHGGEFKPLVELADRLLLSLIKTTSQNILDNPGTPP